MNFPGNGKKPFFMVRNRRQSLCLVDGQKSTIGKRLVQTRPSYHERGVQLHDNKRRIDPVAIRTLTRALAA